MSTLLETCVATHGAEFSINLLGCINDGTEAVSVGGAIIEVNHRTWSQGATIIFHTRRNHHLLLILFFSYLRYHIHLRLM